MAVRGGKRPGSGRPKKEDTTTVAFRVKSIYADKVKVAVKQLIAEMEKGERLPVAPYHENKNPEL
jgi:hypothetical protein